MQQESNASVPVVEGREMGYRRWPCSPESLKALRKDVGNVTEAPPSSIVSLIQKGRRGDRDAKTDTRRWL